MALNLIWNISKHMPPNEIEPISKRIFHSWLLFAISKFFTLHRWYNKPHLKDISFVNCNGIKCEVKDWEYTRHCNAHRLQSLFAIAIHAPHVLWSFIPCICKCIKQKKLQLSCVSYGYLMSGGILYCVELSSCNLNWYGTRWLLHFCRYWIECSSASSSAVMRH